ncbi:MAG: carbohydrate kinase family protein [Nanoarchaeota archaeon]|nr:carbohydrate kinase family protein [Nanoarchaeota archaeon]
MYDVITVGSSTIDVFAHTHNELITIRSHDSKESLIAYPSGGKILIRELNFTIGGGGTNTAVTFSRLGLKTAWLSKLGLDDNGKQIIDKMKDEKVDFIGPRAKGQSGYSIILDSIEHDRTILTYKGLNNELAPKEIDFRKLKARWFYFSSMIGTSLKALEKVALYAKEKKIPYGFNPSSYLCEKGISQISKIVKNAELLVLNKEEAEQLVGKGKPKELAKKLKKLGPRQVIVTDGHRPCTLLYDDKFYVITPSGEKVVESTGAGDAFASSFVAGMIKKDDPKFALHLAQVNAESVLSHHGAKNKLLKWNEALRIMKRKRYALKIMKA